MLNVQLLKNNINTALETYTEIENRYKEYYEYQEYVSGDKITVSFKDLCKTKEEKISDKLLNINNIVFFNRAEINIYYLNQVSNAVNNLNNNIYISYTINSRLVIGNSSDEIYNAIYNITKIDEIKTLYNNIDIVKQAILDLKIPTEAIIDFIDVNSKNISIGPISIKRIKKYFEKYNFVDRLNAAEISKNMKWGSMTTHTAKQDIFYKIIMLYIIKKVRSEKV